MEDVGVFRFRSLLSAEIRELRTWLADNGEEYEREALLCSVLVDDESRLLFRMAEAKTLDLDGGLLILLARAAELHVGLDAEAYNWRTIEETVKNS